MSTTASEARHDIDEISGLDEPGRRVPHAAERATRRSGSSATSARADELEALTHRWQIVRLLERGTARTWRSPSVSTPAPPRSPASRSGCATAPAGTSSCSAAPAREARVSAGVEGRLLVAVPSKGRMAPPALELLAAAGLRFEAGERALHVPCQNAPVDLLLVRPHDIPEYVQDGVVHVGITGANLVAEARADVVRLAELGFARCTLEAAVPTARRSRSSPTSPACGSRPPTRSRRGRRSRRRASRRSSSRSPARSRRRRGSGSPKRSSTSSRPARRRA